MKKICKASYNDFDDSLLISCREKNENIKENFKFGDLIFGLTGNGKIVVVNIQNASIFLSESGIDPLILENFEAVSMQIVTKECSLFIRIDILYKGKEIPVPLGRVYVPQLCVK